MATLSSTERCGIRAKFWNTMPILRLRKSMQGLRGPRAITSVPSIMIWPAVGSSSRLKWRTSVDLPRARQAHDAEDLAALHVQTHIGHARPPRVELRSSTSALERPSLPGWRPAPASARSPKIFQTFSISMTVSAVVSVPGGHRSPSTPRNKERPQRPLELDAAQHCLGQRLTGQARRRPAWGCS